MSSNNSVASARTIADNRAQYKITRTVTDPNGKTHTETIEVLNDDAVKLMRDLQLHDNNQTNVSRFGCFPLTSSTKVSQPSTATKRSMVTQDNKEFIREALQVHNELRQKHNVEPLRLNNDLSNLAQEWANYLASTGSLKHSKTKYHNTHVGENLRSQSWPITGKEMTEAWYGECNKYDYRNRQSYQPGTGHFTQIIWKDSREVGFARAHGESMNFAVVMYYPAGNFLGEFDKNVFPLR
ncbi:unnamed protein product [Rotaria socialis]|uniref:SCP domain-containing protein n=1 Tax=Rotaria socialis TaxID=392032 RepID=A0A818AW80_9BILA|nr:unnamed protein product [Rotaria socialis]CAF3349170.1 unnamed protein product [Rotaria socialis]CAF3405014.1 unnamed protein product [Rotaria socialis]CAF3471484.1 unnamed protein product [Rotaria socialis]CAF3654442.1 unnamed protein product [Rotaria socialis]